ncbi:galactokinase [Allostreptomyces psammosilenae]|uniref:Galactokinase n=1 Tax=Allostreptomyces psammosilenae TaxID=1892865 RepID=A0A853A0P2_9ACTN|nr:galactokinase [Allostreptomyces psammosilenae]NYI03968.1 galactokinase [Allostreptomyces psammosilenae]
MTTDAPRDTLRAGTATGDADVRERFRELFDRTADGVWAAPGRVNVIGEHTDYNDGFVLPIALPHTARVAAARRTDGLFRFASTQTSVGSDADIAVVSVDELAPGAVHGWAAYPAGVAWVLLADGHRLTGADVLIDSDVPTGAGLSSSAALECGTGLALNDLFDAGLTDAELARVAQRAENDFVGVPCGILDQTASMRCTAGHALFYDTRAGLAEQVPFDLAAEGLRLLVIDTRVQHALGDGAYASRRAACEAAAEELGVPALRDIGLAELDGALERLQDDERRRRTRHVVTENARVLEFVERLRAGALRDAGDLMVASHASCRDDYEISCAELDLAVEASLAAGALGARMTGGGFGGSAIALVEADAAEAVADAVRAAFAEAGHAAPRVFTAVPSAGATRIA